MSKIVPVYSESTKQLFVPGFEPFVMSVENEVVLTAPLRLGARVSLLGVSHIQRLVNEGIFDLTDSVDPINARVEALVFRLANGQFIKIDKLDTEDFTPVFSFKSSETASELNLEEVCSVPLGGVLHDVAGAAIFQNGLPDAVFVKLVGRLEPSTSHVQVNGQIEWSAPFAEGETAPLELVGYFLATERMNANRRPRTEAKGVQDFSSVVEPEAGETETAPTDGEYKYGTETTQVVADSEVNWTDAAVAQARADAKPAYVAPRVRLEMGSHGVIVLELNEERAPLSTANFIDYVNAGHYDGLLFHRVIPGFMIQGGGFDKEFKQKPAGKELENEATNGLKNVKYSLAMARTSAPHSATSQFFINIADNSFLDHTSPSAQGWGYAVFGKVVEGQDVVDRIAQVKTGRKGYHDDVPLEPVVIEQAVLVKNAE